MAHTTWSCKYHVVFAPKYRRKAFYGGRRLETGAILRELCRWKGSHPALRHRIYFRPNAEFVSAFIPRPFFVCPLFSVSCSLFSVFSTYFPRRSFLRFFLVPGRRWKHVKDDRFPRSCGFVLPCRRFRGFQFIRGSLPLICLRFPSSCSFICRKPV